jgi:hypothetical protein
MALISPVLHRLSCSNKIVRNALKHEFWVQWSGSGVFVAKNYNATSFSELVRLWHQFGQFCINFRAVTKRPKNEFWIQRSRSGAFVAKFLNVTSFSELVRKWRQFGQFCIDFRVVMKWFRTPQNMSFGSNGVDQVRSLQKMPTQLWLMNLCVNGFCSSSFASTFVQ